MLSQRENQIVRLSAEGLTDKEIALRLGISPDTVESYWRRIRARLNVVSRSAAVAAVVTSRPMATARPETEREFWPVSLTEFFGREDELDVLTDLLSPARSTRLVTLTGAGGSGKSRLALEAVRTIRDRFTGGCWLVELAAIRQFRSVPIEIARVVGLPPVAEEEALDRIGAHLRQRAGPALLLLDNLEQLLVGDERERTCRVVRQLLLAVPELHVLATSRLSINMRGETILEVPPLPVPDASSCDSSEVLFPSVQMFLDRAYRNSRLKGDDPDLKLITTLVSRLEGMPLAIELSAARARTMPLEEIVRRLDSPLSVLSVGPADLPPRQRSLRASIEWSVDLLDESQRRLFACMACFAGSWTLDAAEAIGMNCLGMSRSEVDDRLGDLVEASLVQVEHSGRYRMLETLREYANDLVEREGLGDCARRAHLRFFSSLSKEAGRYILSPDAPIWRHRLTAEIENLRQALDERWADAEALTLARTAMVSLCEFWWHRLLTSESITRYRALLSATPPPTPAEEGALRMQLAWYMSRYLPDTYTGYLDSCQPADHIRPEHAELCDLTDQSIRLLEECQDLRNLAWAHLILPFRDIYEQGGQTRLTHIELAGRWAQKSGDGYVIDLYRFMLAAWAKANPGKVPEAQWLSNLRTLSETSQHPTLRAHALHELSEFERAHGRYEQAMELDRRSMVLNHQMTMIDIEAAVKLAQLYEAQGKYADSEACWLFVIDDSYAEGRVDKSAWAHLEFAKYHLRRNDLYWAAHNLRTAIGVARTAGLESLVQEAEQLLVGIPEEALPST